MGDFANTYPFLAFGGKIDPISEIRNGGLLTSGSVFWVKDINDSDYRTFASQVGPANIFTDIQSAINKTRNDKNDYVFVCPKDSGAAWTNTTNVGSAILINKARVHLISVGYGRTTTGYSNIIRGHGTAAAYDTAVVKVLAPGVEMAGFRVLGTAGTTANGTMNNILALGTASTGTAHDFWFHDGQIDTNLASGGGADGTPIVVTMTNATGPNGARFDNVLIGNTSAGPAQAVSLNHIGKHHKFTNSQFMTFAGNAADILIGNGTGATNFTLFRDCEFINLDSATALNTAFLGSVTVKNPVLAYNCGAINITAVGTDPTVYVAPSQSGTAGAGIHNPGIYLRGSAAITAA